MKKSFNEISGVLLTKNQMKNLKGGTIIGGPNPCEGSKCPINPTYTCAKGKVGNCKCTGVAEQGGEVQSKECETPTVVTPRDSL
jgi:hypothetical protein